MPFRYINSIHRDDIRPRVSPQDVTAVQAARGQCTDRGKLCRTCIDHAVASSMLSRVPAPKWHEPEQHLRASAAAEAVRRRLRALRLTLGMSHTELARCASMATSTLSRIESGERGLSFEHLTPLAAALDISLHELLEPDRHARTPDTPPEPVNIDLRKLRYFAVLAEDLH